MTTIANLIERMLPHGTNPAKLPGTPSWEWLPLNPIDVFAVAATLVERSGAYRHVIAPPDQSLLAQAPAYRFNIDELAMKPWVEISRAWAMKLGPNITREGAEWQAFVAYVEKEFPPQDEAFTTRYMAAFGVPYLPFVELEGVDTTPLQALWQTLLKVHGGLEVVPCGEEEEPWWEAAIKLMIVADMACTGVGFRKRRKDGIESIETMIQRDVIERGKIADAEYLTTLTVNVAESFCAVLPKTRTPTVGCTLRSLSHNLALLPSPGLVQAHWRISGFPPVSAVSTDGGDTDGAPLNLLLIPFPYRISSECFSRLMDEQERDRDWSFFRTRQLWLNRSGKPRTGEGAETDATQDALTIGRFVADLVSRAAVDFEGIHGVVFPEYAMDARTFEAVWDECMKRKATTKLEFIVAGLSEDAFKVVKGKLTEPAPGDMKHGNIVAVRGVQQGAARDPDFNTSRQKHHRWKLNRSQIERYSLSSRLDPKTSWWESIPLGRRIVEFFEPRAGTSMTVLICEDLARSDPCQTVVRSVGPNLVLALLMDGPQRRIRWPGHYAGVLADDPGSSVLTMTSYGLIARGAAADETQSHSIAFFRNSEGRDRELFLPSGFHALAVSLRAHSKTEHTLDGRGDGGAAFIWGLHDVSAVRLPLTEENRWVVEGAR